MGQELLGLNERDEVVQAAGAGQTRAEKVVDGEDCASGVGCAGEVGAETAVAEVGVNEAKMDGVGCRNAAEGGIG